MQLERQNLETYEREISDPLRGHALTELERYVAEMLIDASKERPIDNETIRAAILQRFNERRDERIVKMIVRALRKEHGFPIISSRRPPTGYWWCKSRDEMEEWIRVFRSQAVDQLHTLGRVVRKHFPALAGQLRLEEREKDGGMQIALNKSKRVECPGDGCDAQLMLTNGEGFCPVHQMSILRCDLIS